MGVDRASGDRGNRIFHESRFIDRVGVDGGLNVEFIGNPQGTYRSPPESCPNPREALGRTLRTAAVRRAVRVEALPFPRNPKLWATHPRLPAFARFHAPGVHVVAFVLGGRGPVPPPIMVVIPFDKAS